MKNILKKKKLNQTPFRTKVLSILTKHKNAIRLSTIEEELKDYDRITLYRTIKTFVQNGIIHEISMSGEESTYAICKEECDGQAHHHQHIHFKCTQCDKIFCVRLEAFPNLSIPEYQIDKLEIQATGLCKNCKRV